MNNNKLIYFFLLSMFIISTVSAVTPEEKIYFDAQSQKEVAQINQKIEDSMTSVEKSMRSEFKDSTVFIEQEVTTNLKKGVKAIVIGMSGFMLITLSLFKIMDLKFNKTKIIEKYESELKSKIKEISEYKKQLDNYKLSLVNYQQQNNIRVPQPQYQQVPNSIITKKPKFKLWNIIIGRIISVLFFGVLVFNIYLQFRG